ncbi:MAG: acyl-ACP--UDP-N-acetylglucosamine O-acyltransferase [Acidobacteria bacterium]|nr:acyl-ACP--UDP-N-acetylglucosamine O-acyltransferase [Acidobacteriota bacterium]
MAIHPTAIISPQAHIADSAEIGPYCVIEGEVTIGARTRLMAHVYLDGPTTIGEDNVIFPYAVIGVASPDLKYKGERAVTEIGHRNKIREYVTIHRGTSVGGGLTRVGDDNLLMANAHVAHDCLLASHIIMANGATLGGHVTVEDWAIVGAFSGVHQFCRVGKHSIIGGYSVITRDVMPYSNTTTPRDAKSFGPNKVGLERRGYSADVINALHKALRILTRAGLNTTQAIERVRAEVPPSAEIDDLIAFIEASERGVIK